MKLKAISCGAFGLFTCISLYASPAHQASTPKPLSVPIQYQFTVTNVPGGVTQPYVKLLNKGKKLPGINQGQTNIDIPIKDDDIVIKVFNTAEPCYDMNGTKNPSCEWHLTKACVNLINSRPTAYGEAVPIMFGAIVPTFGPGAGSATTLEDFYCYQEYSTHSAYTTRPAAQPDDQAH